MESQVFNSLDRDSDGFVRQNEVKQLFFNIGMRVSDEEVSKLVAGVTAGASKDIDEPNLTQFIIESSGVNNTDEATELFRALAKAQRGFITAEEIRVVLELNGVTLTEEEAGELVLQHKKRPDTPTGMLSLEEFVAMLN